jgi:ubiquinone/menaquinone biosynthesis C-methylase UbiE
MNSKEKFSGKVANYAKYRPSYPAQFIDYLVKEAGLTEDSIVADIGAGTGILTRLIAGRVQTVYAVEPNPDMRQACREQCRRLTNVIPVDGSAEDTQLAGHSIDLITVAQAFHWFDREKSKAEFKRILKPDGKAVLAWNKPANTQVTRDYDELCRLLCPHYQGLAGGSELTAEAFREFFRNGYCDYRVFANNGESSLENYLGGSLSASYAPSESDDNYGEFIAGLTRIFNKCSANGVLLLHVQTHSYTGQI